MIRLLAAIALLIAAAPLRAEIDIISPADAQTLIESPDPAKRPVCRCSTCPTN
jgi:hypothetical protein